MLFIRDLKTPFAPCGNMFSFFYISVVNNCTIVPCPLDLHLIKLTPHPNLWGVLGSVNKENDKALELYILCATRGPGHEVRLRIFHVLCWIIVHDSTLYIGMKRCHEYSRQKCTCSSQGCKWPLYRLIYYVYVSYSKTVSSVFCCFSLEISMRVQWNERENCEREARARTDRTHAKILYGGFFQSSLRASGTIFCTRTIPILEEKL